jgi:hypothetical protein
MYYSSSDKNWGGSTINECMGVAIWLPKFFETYFFLSLSIPLDDNAS